MRMNLHIFLIINRNLLTRHTIACLIVLPAAHAAASQPQNVVQKIVYLAEIR